MAVGDLFEIKFFCVVEDQVGINVRHWKIGAQAGATPNLQDIADFKSGLASFAYRAWLPAAATYVGCTVQFMNVVPPPDPPAVSTLGQGAGLATGGLLARQVAGLIHLKGAITGRHGRGRVYVPFPSASWNRIDGRVNNTGLTALDVVRAQVAADFTTTFGGDNTLFIPCIRNRATNLFRTVIDSSTDDRWATQKRRGSFGRTNPIPF